MAGGIALVGALGIMIIILAALGLVVVKALGESPWGTFTVAVTIPTAMIMGVYMRIIRPGKVGEASVFGVIVLLLAIYYGQYVAQDPSWGPAFTYSGTRARLGNHHLWRRRFHAAGLAAARAARLPEHVPQDRRRGRVGDWHLLWCSPS